MWYDAKWPKSVIRLVTSDDLDLRIGRLNFSVTSIGYRDRWGRYGPSAEGRGRTRLSSVRVNNMGSLYNLSYFVKSWYFPLRLYQSKQIEVSHFLIDLKMRPIYCCTQTRIYGGILTTIARALGGLVTELRHHRIFIHRCSNDLFFAGQPMTSVIVFISLHIDRRVVHILNRCHN